MRWNAEIMLEKLKVEPDKIWMIGDNTHTDMLGAGKMRIKKILKKNNSVNFSNNRLEKPDFVFNRYSELIELIKKINKNKKNKI